MLLFSTVDLMDEAKCYARLVEILHPLGLRCPRCDAPVAEARIHRHDRAPVLYYRCPCGRVYNAFAGSLFQGTHRACSQLVAILQGVVQGKATAHLARELGASRTALLELRHRLQGHVVWAVPPLPLSDPVVECDEMYQNAGEKRGPPP